MTQNTRGGLKPAKLKNLKTNDEYPVMFNPFEYAISKQNTYQRGNVMGRNAPSYEFTQGGQRSLQLTLYFDTLDKLEPVTKYTEPLWSLMMIDETAVVSETNKSSPPQVAFIWEKLEFKAFVTNMSHKFTLFTADGTPVRCVVTVTLEEGIPADEVPPQESGATSSGQQQTPVTATEGERPDNMAAQNGGSPSDTRAVMSANNVDDPLNVPRGSTLSRP
jgi:hypothetical protein